MKAKTAEAKELQKNNKSEEAAKPINFLLQTHPDHPNVDYQMAWTCDVMGKFSHT